MNNLSNIQNTMKKTTASVTNNKKTDTKKSIKEYILIAVGVTLYVSAWKALLLPYTIVGGGATGICAIIYFISENNSRKKKKKVFHYLDRHPPQFPLPATVYLKITLKQI